jgi:hypothetical protein
MQYHRSTDLLLNNNGQLVAEFSYTSWYEYVWGSGNIHPRNLNVGNRCSHVATLLQTTQCHKLIA